MSGILLLEDDLNRIAAFQRGLVGAAPLRIVHNAKEAIKEMVNGQWDFVFLDHDLGDKSIVGDGTMVAAWIAEHPEKFARTTFVVHSLNPPAGERMANIIFRGGLHVHRRAFVWQDEGFMNYVIAHMKKTTQGSV